MLRAQSHLRAQGHAFGIDLTAGSRQGSSHMLPIMDGTDFGSLFSIVSYLLPVNARTRAGLQRQMFLACVS